MVSKGVKILSALALVVGGSAGGLFASGVFGAGTTTMSAVDAGAIQNVVVAADNFLQNEAVPTPQGVTNPSWAEVGDRPMGGFISLQQIGLHATLRSTGHDWLVNHQIQLLDTATAANMVNQQTHEIETLFTGGIEKRNLAGLAVLTKGEETKADLLISPGGASVVKWTSLKGSGNEANVDCRVALWKQVDRVVVSSNGVAHLETTIKTQLISEHLMLIKNANGIWQVSALDQQPIDGGG